MLEHERGPRVAGQRQKGESERLVGGTVRSAYKPPGALIGRASLEDDPRNSRPKRRARSGQGPVSLQTWAPVAGGGGNGRILSLPTLPPYPIKSHEPTPYAGCMDGSGTNQL